MRFISGALPALAALFFSLSCNAEQNDSGPDCSAINGWPTQTTAVHLIENGLMLPKGVNKYAALISSMPLNEIQRQEIQRAGIFDASVNIFPGPLYRQVYRITFTPEKGQPVSVMTTTLASDDECSVALVSVALIAKELVK